MGKEIEGEFKLVDEVKREGKDNYFIATVGTEKVCIMEGEKLSGISNGNMVKVLLPDKGNIVQNIEMVSTVPVESVSDAPQQTVQKVPTKPPVSTQSAPTKTENRNGKTIPSSYITEIKGKKFITANGLLHMAHEKGFISWSVDDIEVDFDKQSAWCKGTAEFKVGEIVKLFDGVGSCTPKNATSMTSEHFVEMAETRAKSRALRTALNIDMTTAEELKK